MLGFSLEDSGFLRDVHFGFIRDSFRLFFFVRDSQYNLFLTTFTRHAFKD